MTAAITVSTVASTIVPACGTLASTTSTANTIEASPRGPNQPRYATVGGARPAAHHGDRDRHHAHDRETQQRVQGHLPGRPLDERPNERRAEHHERECVSSAPRSSAGSGCATSRRVPPAPPNTMPATNAAMKPLPPSGV